MAAGITIYVSIGRANIHSYHVTSPSMLACNPVPSLSLFASVSNKNKKWNSSRKVVLREKEKAMRGDDGDMSSETRKKKKKKGRPSLLELQKRSLKQQQLQKPQQPPSLLQKTPNLINPNSSINSNHRSARRHPNLKGDSPVPGWISGGNDDDDERLEKKHKPLLGFNSSRNHQHYPLPSAPNSASYGSDSNADGDDPDASLKRRKFTNANPGSYEMGEKLPKVTDTLGSPVESGPTSTTSLPDQKLLVFILDRLQKKDTYGVFSEPVDSEELPDYHDIIAHPMDFSTVRKKLDEGAYTTLEQFEIDVFLICSNAMQYNAPDTIYFRQARSMQELARKDFENLRQDSDEGEPQVKVVRRGRPSGKSLKRSLVSSPSIDHVGSECSSVATLAAGRDASILSNTYNLRKGLNSLKLRPADAFSPSKENHAICSSEWENEFPAFVVRAVMKYGMKHFAVDENRRDTYNHSSTSGHEQRTFSTLDGELKQLIPVGLSAENGYATSLARFAANLGPVVWKIASRKIESVLPTGLKFGPGWVGENRTVEQPQCSLSDKQRTPNSLSHNPPGRFLSTATSGSNSIAASRFPLKGREDMEAIVGLTSQNDSTSVPSHQFQQSLVPHSGINGSIGGFGFGYYSQTGLVTQCVNSLSEKTSVPTQTLVMVSGASDFLPKEAKLADSSITLHSGNAMAVEPEMVSHAAATNVGLQWSTYNEPNFLPFAPDLNVRFLAPGSPSSSVPIGSPQRPDLALQL